MGLLKRGRASGVSIYAENADKLDGYDQSQLQKGWSNSYTHREYQLVLFNGGETNWRRLARIEFAPVTDGVASYTGATFEVEIWDHKPSWGQAVPAYPLRQQIRITNSNAYTTSNFRTAAINGDWLDYDYLRVVKVDTWVWEIQGRAISHYHGTGFKVVTLGNAGVQSIDYGETSDGGTAFSPVDGVEYLFSGGGSRIDGDSRGWQELTSGMMVSGACTPYQTGLVNTWTPRFMRRKGIVFLAGLITPQVTSAATTLFTLPGGYRPISPGVMMFQQMQSNNYSCRFDVRPDGTAARDTALSAVSGASSWINLGGISYPAGG